MLRIVISCVRACVCVCTCACVCVCACNDTCSFIPLGKKFFRAIFDYSAICKDDLTLKVGDIVEYLGETEEEGWYKGRLKGKIGIFPFNYVEELPSSAVSNDVTSTDGTQLTSPPAAEISTSKPSPPIPSEEGPAAIGHRKDSTSAPKGEVGVAWTGTA